MYPRLSCDCCVIDTTQKPIQPSPSPGTPHLAACQNDAVAAAADDDDATINNDVIKIQQPLQVDGPSMSEAATSCRAAANVKGADLDDNVVTDTVIDRSLDDRKLLDWWWTTVCQSRDLQPDQSVSSIQLTYHDMNQPV